VRRGVGVDARRGAVHRSAALGVAYDRSVPSCVRRPARRRASPGSLSVGVEVRRNRGSRGRRGVSQQSAHRLERRNAPATSRLVDPRASGSVPGNQANDEPRGGSAVCRFWSAFCAGRVPTIAYPPRHYGLSSGTVSSPSIALTIGAPSFSATRSTSSPAPRAPAPMKITSVPRGPVSRRRAARSRVAAADARPARGHRGVAPNVLDRAVTGDCGTRLDVLSGSRSRRGRAARSPSAPPCRPRSTRGRSSR
jgi:hypothetical protein